MNQTYLPPNEIFTEVIPFYDRVPLVFFFPQATSDEEMFIKEHGGLLSNIVECYTIQIGKRDTPQQQQSQPFNESQFFAGTVYDFQWLLDTVRQYDQTHQARLLKPDPYMITQVEYIPPPHDKNHDDYSNPGSHVPQGSSSRKHNNHGSLSGQRTRFTVRELIKIFEVTTANPCKKNKNQVYWQRFIRKGYVFPGRSVNSVNAQW